MPSLFDSPSRSIPYVDYLANTSLDEAGTTFTAPELGQGQFEADEQRVRNVRTISQRVRADVEYEERRARRQDAERAMLRNENPRLDRIANVRLHTEALAAKLHIAVTARAEADPVAAKVYTDFAHLCLAATCTSVRAVDIVYRQTKPPADVHKALRDLSKQLHIEARLKCDYEISEGGTSAIDRYVRTPRDCPRSQEYRAQHSAMSRSWRAHQRHQVECLRFRRGLLRLGRLA